MELIDKQDAINVGYKIVENLAESSCSWDDLKMWVREQFDQISTIQPEHWIPVTERLPETHEPVLIYAWSVHHVIASYREVRRWDGEYVKTWVMNDAYNAPHEIKHDVIAWMPLPKPYQSDAK